MASIPISPRLQEAISSFHQEVLAESQTQIRKKIDLDKQGAAISLQKQTVDDVKNLWIQFYQSSQQELKRLEGLDARFGQKLLEIHRISPTRGTGDYVITNLKPSYYALVKETETMARSIQGLVIDHAKRLNLLSPPSPPRQPLGERIVSGCKESSDKIGGLLLSFFLTTQTQIGSQVLFDLGEAALSQRTFQWVRPIGTGISFLKQGTFASLEWVFKYFPEIACCGGSFYSIKKGMESESRMEKVFWATVSILTFWIYAKSRE